MQDEYAEVPRPNLYSVLKKLKETDSGQFVHRICYFARIKDNVFKGDFEKELNMWVRNVASMAAPLESDEDDFIEGLEADE